MPDLVSLIEQGSSNLWIFISTSVILGALHGLEPGHSKTMMAAFIIAIRGTIVQAILLGLAATVSHTAVVWIIAFAGMYFLGGKIDAETTEPYFQMVSGALMVGLALWMMYRSWKHQRAFQLETAHTHDNGEHTFDTGHGVVTLSIYEVNQPPRFRIAAADQSVLSHLGAKNVTVEITRADGTTQEFKFAMAEHYLESTITIPEPHDFTARLCLVHGHHQHEYDVEFSENGHGHNHEHEHSHTHDHVHDSPEMRGLDVTSPGYQDAHELAHANDIRRRFANQSVTTKQIIFFGITGGLIPCPASVTVLLLCLQLQRIALGALLVTCFSVGLALTMVTSGVIAAVGVRQVTNRWSGFTKIARKAPYLSGGIILIIGFYICYGGLKALL